MPFGFLLGLIAETGILDGMSIKNRMIRTLLNHKIITKQGVNMNNIQYLSASDLTALAISGSHQLYGHGDNATVDEKGMPDIRCIEQALQTIYKLAKEDGDI